MYGKVIFTNLSRYSELSERTYRRHYAEPFEFIAVNQCLILEGIAAESFQVGAIDCSFIPKSGKAAYDLDRFYNGKASRSEPRLEISTIAVVDVAASLGYALSVQQTPATGVATDVPMLAETITRTDHYISYPRCLTC